MSEKQNGLTDLGPPPRSSGDWSTTPRPGRALDAAYVRLGHPRPRRRWRRLSSLLHSLASIGRH